MVSTKIRLSHFILSLISESSGYAKSFVARPKSKNPMVNSSIKTSSQSSRKNRLEVAIENESSPLFEQESYGYKID